MLSEIFGHCLTHVNSNEEIPEKGQVKVQCDYYTRYQCFKKKRAIVAALMTEGTTILERKSTSRYISEK